MRIINEFGSYKLGIMEELVVIGTKSVVLLVSHLIECS
jgi:hypothetical protein